MSKFIVEIDTDNAAFDVDKVVEVQRILKEELVDVRPPEETTLTDINGNTVGTAKFVDEAN